MECTRHRILPIKIISGCHTANIIKCPQLHDPFNSTRINFQTINKEIRIIINFSIGKQPLELTMDTGANVSMLRPDNLLGTTKLMNNDSITILGISTDTQLKTMGRVFPQMNINGHAFSHHFHIAEEKFNINNDGILGGDFLIKYGVTIDYSTNTLQIYLPSTENPYIKDPLTRTERKMETENGQDHEVNEENITENDVLKMGESFDRDRCKINIGRAIEPRIKHDKDYYKNVETEYETIRQLKKTELPFNTEKQKIIEYFLEENLVKNVYITDQLKPQGVNYTRTVDERAKYILNSLNLSHCTNEEKIEMEKLCDKYKKGFFIEGDLLEHTEVMSQSPSDFHSDRTCLLRSLFFSQFICFHQAGLR